MDKDLPATTNDPECGGHSTNNPEIPPHSDMQIDMTGPSTSGFGSNFRIFYLLVWIKDLPATTNDPEILPHSDMQIKMTGALSFTVNLLDEEAKGTLPL
jgi:hypothetical protein